MNLIHLVLTFIDGLSIAFLHNCSTVTTCRFSSATEIARYISIHFKKDGREFNNWLKYFWYGFIYLHLFLSCLVSVCFSLFFYLGFSLYLSLIYLFHSLSFSFFVSHSLSLSMSAPFPSIALILSLSLYRSLSFFFFFSFRSFSLYLPHSFCHSLFHSLFYSLFYSLFHSLSFSLFFSLIIYLLLCLSLSPLFLFFYLFLSPTLNEISGTKLIALIMSIFQTISWVKRLLPRDGPMWSGPRETDGELIKKLWFFQNAIAITTNGHRFIFSSWLHLHLP